MNHDDICYLVIKTDNYLSKRVVAEVYLNSDNVNEIWRVETRLVVKMNLIINENDKVLINIEIMVIEHF